MGFKKKPGPRMIAKQGIISGGALDGWAFTFQRFSVSGVIDNAGGCWAPRGELVCWCRVTPPHWPFPKDAALLFESFHALVRAKGGKRVNADELIRSAFTLEGLEAPPILAERTTLRRLMQEIARPARRHHEQGTALLAATKTVTRRPTRAVT